MPKKSKQWHIKVAAEAFAAGLFARCEFDVSVQYGADQPEYDLVVTRGDRMLKVSVKGTQDTGWGLPQSYMEKGKADYHGAIDRWLADHGERTVLCFVQFRGVDLMGMPRVYLATPREVAQRLHASRNGKGGTILWEDHTWGPRAVGAGTVERLPDSWKFSPDRVAHLLGTSQTAR